MNHFLNGVARAVAETFVLPEPILEIGSYQVAGQEELINLRSLFPGKRYTGLDCRAGPGVDLVADAEQLPQATGSVGTVIAMNTFEHVRHFWRAFAEVERVLRPDGRWCCPARSTSTFTVFPAITGVSRRKRCTCYWRVIRVE